MTMTERMDEILNSNLYNLYCPVCSSRGRVMIPNIDDAEDCDRTIFCTECGTTVPLGTPEDHRC